MRDMACKRGAAMGVQTHHFLMGQAWCFAPARSSLTHTLVAMGVANFIYKMGALSGGSPATFIAAR